MNSQIEEPVHINSYNKGRSEAIKEILEMIEKEFHWDEIISPKKWKKIKAKLKEVKE